jgi:LacI family transcriptional regulator
MKNRRLIAIIIPNLDQDFYNHMVTGAEQAAERNRYLSAVITTHDDQQLEMEKVRQLVSHRVDGFLISPAAQSRETVAFLQEQGFPLVVLERSLPLPVYQVMNDHEPAIYQSVEFLVKNGHRNIAYIGWDNQLPVVTSRQEIFWKAIDEQRIPRQQIQFKLGPTNSPETGYQLAKEVIIEGKSTVIFAAQNHLAKGIIPALKETGCKVPDDISVFVYGAGDWARMNNPAISGMCFSDYAQGEKALEILVKLIEEEPPELQRYLLPVQICKGQSVKKLSGSN